MITSVIHLWSMTRSASEPGIRGFSISYLPIYRSSHPGPSPYGRSTPCSKGTPYGNRQAYIPRACSPLSWLVACLRAAAASSSSRLSRCGRCRAEPTSGRAASGTPHRTRPRHPGTSDLIKIGNNGACKGMCKPLLWRRYRKRMSGFRIAERNKTQKPKVRQDVL